MLIIVEGKLVELRWRAKRGAEMLNEKEQREAESFVRAIERYRRQVDSLLCRTQAHQARAHHPPCEMNIPSNVRIKKATYLGDYAIRFAFSDGHASDIDFLPFLSAAGQNPMNSQYLDVTRFRDFKLHRNVDVYWDDWEMCFRFETLFAGRLPKMPKVIRRPVRMASKRPTTKA